MPHKCLKRILSAPEEYMLTVQQCHLPMSAQQSNNKEVNIMLHTHYSQGRELYEATNVIE